MSHSGIAEARRSGYGETVERPKTGTFLPPPNFEESTFPQSLPNGAHTVYREDRPTDSVQIRVYGNKVTYQLDRYNPEYHPAKHAAFDATAYTAAAVGIALALFGSGGG